MSVAHQEPVPLVYSIEEVRALLGIGRTAAYEAVRLGRIPSVRVGKRLLVPREALHEFLAQPSRQRASVD